MGLNKFSDYGSGSPSESASSWALQDTWEGFQSRLQDKGFINRPRSSSFADMEAKSRLEANMQEFRMNGFDSPYEPDVEKHHRDTREHHHHTYGRAGKRAGGSPGVFGGLGPSSSYLRQKSWPAPEVTPAAPLPRARDWSPLQDISQRPLEDIEVPGAAPLAYDSRDNITEEQMLVLKSLPNEMIYFLLRQIEQNREQQYTNLKRQDQSVECRFCKNNGERASFFRSHALRVRGRVTCPVLRAFVCRRCGAYGDRAHTLKYCPLATADERKQSSAIMQSLRMASGRRRNCPAPLELIDDYVVMRRDAPYSPQTPYTPQSPHSARDCAPLDPIWEALERKLML